MTLNERLAPILARLAVVHPPYPYESEELAKAYQEWLNSQRDPSFPPASRVISGATVKGPGQIEFTEVYQWILHIKPETP